jgi:hypothetical protein
MLHVSGPTGARRRGPALALLPLLGVLLPGQDLIRPHGGTEPELDHRVLCDALRAHWQLVVERLPAEVEALAFDREARVPLEAELHVARSIARPDARRDRLAARLRDEHLVRVRVRVGARARARARARVEMSTCIGRFAGEAFWSVVKLLRPCRKSAAREASHSGTCIEACVIA